MEAPFFITAERNDCLDDSALKEIALYDKHMSRLKFLMRFFEIELMIIEVPEENSSLFQFIANQQQLERKVYDCGNEGYHMILL